MTLLAFASSIEDYRFDRNKVHSAETIIYITLAAVICGAETWNEIEDFGHCKIDFFSRTIPSFNGIPSHDTFNRFFTVLDTSYFENQFREWVKSICGKYKGVVAIDGKTICGAYESEEAKLFRGTYLKPSSPKYKLHMVSAWAADNGISLGQIKTEEKSNEITAIPELLEALDIKECIITIDAMGCQKTIASKIIDKEADYVLAVKNNHMHLYKEIEHFFTIWSAEKPNRVSVYEKSETGHGRLEKRTCIACDNLYWLNAKDYTQWAGLKTFACVITERTVPGERGPRKQKETRYYISSLALDAELIASSVRKHWSVENNLHWQLDVSFNEDYGRKKNNAAVNFSLVSKTALSMLKHYESKSSIARKRKSAGWSDDVLQSILSVEKF